MVPLVGIIEIIAVGKAFGKHVLSLAVAITLATAPITLTQWRSHTSGVRGVRTPCQDNTYFLVPVCDFSVL